MTKLRMTTIALAAAASLGALSISSAPAFAGHGGGGHGGGHGGGGMHMGHGGGFGGHWGGHRWGYRGYGYGLYTAYASDCYYVRRFGELIKVCE
jgi:hypothetical protein